MSARDVIRGAMSWRWFIMAVMIAAFNPWPCLSLGSGRSTCSSCRLSLALESSYVLSVFVCWYRQAVMRVVPCHAGCADAVRASSGRMHWSSELRTSSCACARACAAESPSEASGVSMVSSRTTLEKFHQGAHPV